MNLKNISTAELEVRAVKLVQTERKIIHLVLNHLLELEDRKVYAQYEYDGMYTYLIKKLGYSGPAASLRLKALRLLRSTPMVAAQVENRSICLSQMAQVQSAVVQARSAGKVISSEATLKVLKQIEHKNTFETKSILAKEFDLPLIEAEVTKPQKDDSVRIEITLTAEQFKDLEQAKSLLSHVCHAGNWAEVIALLAQKFNQQKLLGRSKLKDKKTSKALTHAVSASEVKSDEIKFRPRKYISVHTKRFLLHRALGCCEYQDPHTGRRCSSRYQLQVDHIHPWSLGGSNKTQNLRILCRSHNALLAESQYRQAEVNK